jgi:hypothetical protein
MAIALESNIITTAISVIVSAYYGAVEAKMAIRWRGDGQRLIHRRTVR